MGLEASTFSGHSLRSGFLISAAESGANRRVDLFKEHAGAAFLLLVLQTKPPQRTFRQYDFLAREDGKVVERRTGRLIHRSHELLAHLERMRADARGQPQDQWLRAKERAARIAGRATAYDPEDGSARAIPPGKQGDAPHHPHPGVRACGS